MNKLLVLFFISISISSSTWAEKYEYVRLKLKGSSEIFDQSTNRYIYDSFELNSGDVATLVASSGNFYLIIDDGEDTIQIDETWGNSITHWPQKIVGPCTVKIGWTHSSVSWTGIFSFAIKRASETGSTTLAWNGTEWEGSNDGSQQANNNSNGVTDPTNIKYDELLGWAWFTNTNWVYSYTNLSWYYMHPTTEGFYVWNANLPENGWMLLERG